MGSCCGSSNNNQDVTHQSGISRLLNSILVAVLVAPLMIIGISCLLGWNERRSVCDSKAITQGKQQVMEVGCDSATAGDGSLVIFSCPLSNSGLTPLTAPGTDFESAMQFVGTGLGITAEMYQCVEHASSQTTKDSIGGGTTTVTTYTYGPEWRSAHVDSGAFHAKSSQSFIDNCNVENPAWPAEVPTSGEVYASSVRAGAFTLGTYYVHQVPLATTLTASSIPGGWYQGSAGAYMSDQWKVSAQTIGQVRVTFRGNDWNAPMVTVLGQNSGGTMGSWTASSSWLCSGFTLQALELGAVGKDQFFQDLSSQASAVTWVLRFVGFFVAWLAFSLLFGPLQVVADCVPCIGPCLGNSIQLITCCVACLPATACTLGVIGVVWVAMRPAVGVPLLVIFVCVVVGLVVWKICAAKKKETAAAPGP